MELSEEQKKIIDTVKKENCNLLKISARSGTGKTTMLTEIVKAIKPESGLYLAYNKAIADEAKEKFGSNIVCSTTHSLAYKYTVRANNLKVNPFTFKDIKEKIRYDTKLLIIEIINKFSLSKYIKFDDFISNNKELAKQMNAINKKILILAKQYIGCMFQGKTDITHAVYLKMFHILLANKKIKLEKQDIIMLDEAGDLNPVTLEIFKLLDANKKVMVGDISQNIYSFNGTINGFEEMKDEGVLLQLTQSFRCSKDIASRVEKFMKIHYDEDFKFSGVNRKEIQNTTIAYISRTNSSLIGSMIELMKSGEKFNLARQPQSIFELILILLYLKPGGEIRQKQWKHLQEDVDLWNIDESLQNEYLTYMSYIASKYNDDIELKSALAIIGKYSREEIFKAYAYSKQCKESKVKHKITLTTSHSSKGLEFHKVYIHEDLNKVLMKILDKEPEKRTESELEELRLYYVACTRASDTLINANMLEYKVNI